MRNVCCTLLLACIVMPGNISLPSTDNFTRKITADVQTAVHRYGSLLDDLRGFFPPMSLPPRCRDILHYLGNLPPVSRTKHCWTRMAFSIPSVIFTSSVSTTKRNVLAPGAPFFGDCPPLFLTCKEQFTTKLWPLSILVLILVCFMFFGCFCFFLWFLEYGDFFFLCTEEKNRKNLLVYIFSLQTFFLRHSSGSRKFMCVFFFVVWAWIASDNFVLQLQCPTEKEERKQLVGLLARRVDGCCVVTTSKKQSRSFVNFGLIRTRYLYIWPNYPQSSFFFFLYRKLKHKHILVELHHHLFAHISTRITRGSVRHRSKPRLFGVHTICEKQQLSIVGAKYCFLFLCFYNK